MRNPLSIAIAAAVAAAAAAVRAAEPRVRAAEPPSTVMPRAAPPARLSADPLSANRIPREPGPTAEAVGRLADDPSPEAHSRIYDGGNLVVGSGAVKGNTGVEVGKGQPAAKPRVPDAPATTVPAKKKEDKPPFLDEPTIGFAALGVLVGGFIGIGLGLGLLGPILGAVIVAALLVGLFKWKGYRKPE